MATGQNIETRGHLVGFKEEISKVANASENDFFTWFDKAKDKQTAFVRGAWDFAIHMMMPASKYLSFPESKVALEIGHGGGRILAAASRAFGQVVGVDIHDNNEKVSAELNRRGIDNFQLQQSSGDDLPVPQDSIDFVYSFIVLQHVERIEVFENYLKESYRVLKPGGIAVLYFGRKYKYSINRDSKVRYWLDRSLERFKLSKGYETLPAKVNMTNLRVSLTHARKLAKQTGFEVVDELVSRKTVPDGADMYGGQNGLVLMKIKTEE